MFDFFLIFAQNIACGYSLKSPHHFVCLFVHIHEAIMCFHNSGLITYQVNVNTIICIFERVLFSLVKRRFYFIFSLTFLLPLIFYLLTAFHYRISNAYNFLVCERKQQVWIFILRNSLVPKLFNFA